ncbi:MAG: VPLPA-CTERM sorting domain-containing protein, partial [Gammaproteobacteria bacterium]
DLRINEASAADNASNETVSISEPASMALLGLSLAGIGLLGRDKKA